MRVISRDEWGGIDRPIPRDTTVKRELGVHHTVSANRVRSAGEERGELRMIEAGHLARGFSMIGYSWLVFDSGRIYQGRGKYGLPAAQAGENSGTWAVAWVGNADLRAPSVEARRTIRALIESLTADDGLRRLGGHQEFPGQATACPGSKLLPYVRKWRREYDLGRPFP